jgi:hypothetical protein
MVAACRGVGGHRSRARHRLSLSTSQIRQRTQGANLKDLAYMGGWKDPETVLTVYQQPELEVQREGFAGRRKMKAAG